MRNRANARHSKSSSPGCGDILAMAWALGLSTSFLGCGSAALTDPGDPADASTALFDAGPPTPDAIDIVTEFTMLSETGLYQDIENRVLADGIIEYAPEYRSWVDGLATRTWIWLPPGQVIDSSDMDYWYFPVGTKVWQLVYQITGPNELWLETRLIQRRGTDDDDIWEGSFIWNDTETDAAFSEDGAYNIRGTSHDVPPASHCNSCHRGQTSHILGFCAVQLSYGAAVNLNTLAADGLLSHGPETPDMYPIPGAGAAHDALGHLHADCAHCHTSGLGLGTFKVTGFDARLFVDARTVEDTESYKTGVNQGLMFWFGAGLTERIVPGDPSSSAVLYRMNFRGGRPAMPPRFTAIPNGDAVDALTAWINSL